MKYYWFNILFLDYIIYILPSGKIEYFFLYKLNFIYLKKKNTLRFKSLSWSRTICLAHHIFFRPDSPFQLCIVDFIYRYIYNIYFSILETYWKPFFLVPPGFKINHYLRFPFFISYFSFVGYIYILFSTSTVRPIYLPLLLTII